MISFLDAPAIDYKKIIMKMMIPVLNADRIYLYPNNVSLYLKNNKSLIVSKDGWEILKYCDGMKTIDMIYDLLSIENEIDKDGLINFITIAHKKNIIEFVDSFKKKDIKVFGDGRSIIPQFCSLELTDNCNLECNYCYGEFKRGKGNFFGIEDIKVLFDDLEKIGVLVVELTGGEPLLHPNFIEILKIALNKFETITVLSNGVLFNDEVIKIIQKYQNKISIQISIDGCSEETNFKVRRVSNTFEKTLNTLKRLRDIGANYTTVYMITEENKHEIRSIFNLFRQERFTNLTLSKATPFGRGCDSMECLVKKDDYEVNNTIIEVIKEYPDIISNKLSNQQDYYERGNDASKFAIYNCGVGWKLISIASNGDVRSCSLLGNIGKIGNIFNQNIYEILNSEKGLFYMNFSKMRKEKICCDCAYKNDCAMCIVRIYGANRQRLKDGVGLCEIAKKNKMDKYLDFQSDFKFSI